MNEADLSPRPICSSEQLFPINHHIAKRILRTFEFSDPKRYAAELTKESDYAEASNISLNKHWLWLVEGDVQNAEYHGALVMHRLLDEQAHQVGGRLPRFRLGYDQELIHGYVQRILRMSLRTGMPSVEIFEWFDELRLISFGRNESDLIAELDPYINTFHDSYTDKFIDGMLATYFPVKYGLQLPSWYQ